MCPTYHITTFGCQMNTYDTEVMRGLLEAHGWQPSDDETAADFVMFNTCVVRHGAEQRALTRIGQLARLKRERPGLVVGVAGCMAQKEGEALLEKLPHVDLLLGTRAIVRLGELLDKVCATGRPQVCTEILDEAYPERVTPVRQDRHKALVNIIFGCNKSCAYCIVPRTRGREVSRPLAEIVAELRGLAADGFREVTLVGQNVNSYRRREGDQGGRAGFADLLRACSAATPDMWIRYITSHPRDCNDAHIDAVAQCPNICENFHLPVQAGATSTLRRMKRAYTRERYLELAAAIRERVPGATITSDLIVGFPGETDEEYEQTLSLMAAVRFDAAFTYMYSPREGTPAAEEYADPIPLEVKKARLAQVIELQERHGLDRNRAHIGDELDVLVEGPAPRTSGDLLARTRGDKMVIAPGPAERIGRFARVRVRDANSHTLFGEFV